MNKEPNMTHKELFEALKLEGDEIVHESKTLLHIYDGKRPVTFGQPSGKLWIEERMLGREDVNFIQYGIEESELNKCDIAYDDPLFDHAVAIAPTLPQALLNAVEKYFKEVGK